ncbi:homeobox protein 2-like [Aphis craccivora]|uniref:Homeobox protein 2-like n=1 Tax=Aphis craccivora TaxID=307492 RepID=A0A6G0XW09_APHCR|nr:homeobox protein 2-like [Aphis craccivora]
MDGINRARHLQPPIDQTEMVDQITSHFSYNIALALRGLRITTTNDLLQQLTYLQCAHAPSNNYNAPSNNSNNNNTPSNSHQQNSYNNPSGQNSQNR